MDPWTGGLTLVGNRGQGNGAARRRHGEQPPGVPSGASCRLTARLATLLAIAAAESSVPFADMATAFSQPRPRAMRAISFAAVDQSYTRPSIRRVDQRPTCRVGHPRSLKDADDHRLSSHHPKSPPSRLLFLQIPSFPTNAEDHRRRPSPLQAVKPLDSKDRFVDM
ncbi:hypothetical protein EJB05_44451, partial [Eragrostis curvula]